MNHLTNAEIGRGLGSSSVAPEPLGLIPDDPLGLTQRLSHQEVSIRNLNAILSRRSEFLRKKRLLDRNPRNPIHARNLIVMGREIRDLLSNNFYLEINGAGDCVTTTNYRQAHQRNQISIIKIRTVYEVIDMFRNLKIELDFIGRSYNPDLAEKTDTNTSSNINNSTTS